VKITFVANIFGDEMIYKDGDPYRPDLAPGSAKWAVNQEGVPAALLFVCPCGCGALCHVNVTPGSASGWGWDFNTVAPTLTPSILRTMGCRWHGYLTAGEWRPC
jgi:hypothetical protein